MEDIKIGLVTINYNEDGSVSHTKFEPAAEVVTNPENLAQLLRLPPTDNAEVLKKNAQSVVANWYTKVGDIDLIDHFEYGFVSTVKECVKYGSGQIKKCVIDFSIKKYKESPMV